MKICTLANEKGGVGKSAIVCQLAYYLRIKRALRILVIDLDHQRNTSKALKTGGLAKVAPFTSSTLLDQSISDITDDPFVIIPGDSALKGMERQPEKRKSIGVNLQKFLLSVDSRFDVCLIDTNPNPDVRQIAALAVSDSVLSPIQLNQEAIDGIAALRNNVDKIKAVINKRLEFIGILPNIVEPTPFQRENFKNLAMYYASLLIRPDPEKGKFAFIRKTTAIAEAQAAGVAVWELKKTSAREAWHEIEPFFSFISNRILSTKEK